MTFRNIALFVLIFIAGILSASLIYETGKITSESPVEVIKNPIETVTETFTAVVNDAGVEQSSPGDHISEEQIRVYNDRVILDIENAVWSRFVDTNSMDPFLDEGANGIEITPESASDIHIGDIISYRAEDVVYESEDGVVSHGIIIHRVIAIGVDEQGKYFITKGDNNPVKDPHKVRFEQVQGILVGIIY